MNHQEQPTANVLVVDDDRIILESITEFLRLEGYAVSMAATFDVALTQLDDQVFDLVITDVNMPGGSGFELQNVLRKRFPQAVLVMITGYGTIESAVEAIKLGAFDYLTKPVVDDELKLCVQRALAQQALLRENVYLKKQLQGKYDLGGMVGRDHSMQKVFEVVEAVAPSKISVLIQGASGTGKSLMARVLHQQSDRKDKPFVEVSCGAIPETLLESELFGYARGAFTGAISNKQGKFKAAHSGTLFLDEIATASPALQVKLLRVLQTKQFEPIGSNKTETVDVRMIFASNTNLEEDVKSGQFREDLLYRINVVTMDMPALSQRMGDVPLLAKHLLEKTCIELGHRIEGFDENVIRYFQQYTWPGNVRELENVIARASVMCRNSVISIDDLPDKVLSAPELASATNLTGSPMPLREALELPEKRIIEAALKANGWNRQQTARQLDINRTTLYKKMKHYGLEPTQSQLG